MLQRQKPWLQLGGKHGHTVEGLALPRRLTPTLAFGGIRAPITREYSAKGSPHRCALLTRNEARRGGDDVDHPVVATSMQQPTCRVSISPPSVARSGSSRRRSQDRHSKDAFKYLETRAAQHFGAEGPHRGREEQRRVDISRQGHSQPPDRSRLPRQPRQLPLSSARSD